MSTLCTAVLVPASQQLSDETNVTWPIANLIPYLNMGLVEVINLNRAASPNLQNQNMIAGIKQPLPAEAIDLVDVTYNMDSTGLIHLTAINSIPKERLDHLLPDWTTWPPSATVQYNVEDSRDPKNMYVFPPQPSPTTGIVETLVTVEPTLIANATDPFPFDASYVNVLIDYVTFRALAEETSIPNALAKSIKYENRYLQSLGLKSQVDNKQTEENN